jgi:hypothetical protein
MSRFEDRLWTELVEQHGQLLADGPLRPVSAPREHAPARRRGRARSRAGLTALGLAVAAALAAVVIGLSSGPPTSAYAVVSNPNGTVTVTIRELAGISGADEKLVALGIPVRVVPSEAACPTRPGQYESARISPELSERISHLAGPPSSAAIVIDPSVIPPGDTVVIAARTLEPGVLALQTVLYEGATPPCLPLTG